MELNIEPPTGDVPAIAETVLNNDQNSANPTGNETSLAAKALGAAHGAFDRFKAKISRGRGRPKNCPKCGVSETKCQCLKGAGDAMGLSPSGEAGDAEIVEEIVSDAVGAVVKTATSVADSFLLSKAIQKTKDEAFIERTLTRCQPTEKELDGLGKLSAVCLRKYGVGTEYMPEIGLGAIALGISARYALAFRTLATMPDRQVETPKGA